MDEKPRPDIKDPLWLWELQGRPDRKLRDKDSRKYYEEQEIDWQKEFDQFWENNND